jgi:hypothetical protein
MGHVHRRGADAVVEVVHEIFPLPLLPLPLLPPKILLKRINSKEKK